MKNLLWIIIVVAAVIGFKYWGNIQDEVITYNDSMIDLLDEDNLPYEAYLNHLNQFYNGEAVEIEQMREALAALETNHKDVMLKVSQVTVPDHDTCRAFHESFLRYMENSTAIITAYGEVTTFIETHNPGTEVDLDEVDLMLNELLAKDNKLFEGITTTQKAMAKKFDFDLE